MPPSAKATVGPVPAESSGFAFRAAFGRTTVLIVPVLLLSRHAKQRT
ncbi:hypothetical protein GCM10027445_52150 [Amycolatopsis endophytica]|uniref:Uncharacterized protein n=1 Tax=Amycolatopsis endophytica TaxID=860233 RepID=A0A853BBD0_9PSEU|nr:hypothetical protein [Amycolatopsis endophytica]NYI91696.1 hypothetical protein [Amycolatopsis endophytica]